MVSVMENKNQNLNKQNTSVSPFLFFCLFGSLAKCKCIDKYMKRYMTINMITFEKEMELASDSSFTEELVYCWNGLQG